jgi:hypothetical protein
MNSTMEQMPIKMIKYHWYSSFLVSSAVWNMFIAFSF